MQRVFFGALLVAGLAGCYSVGRKIDMDAVKQIKQGESTREDVRGLLKSPDSISTDGYGNETWMYMYARASAKPESFVPVVGMFAGGANSQSQMVMVQFGPDGKVSNLITNISGMEVGSGASAGGRADIPEVEEDKREK